MIGPPLRGPDRRHQATQMGISKSGMDVRFVLAAGLDDVRRGDASIIAWSLPSQSIHGEKARRAQASIVLLVREVSDDEER